MNQRKSARITGIRFMAVGATTLALGLAASPALALDIPVNVPGVINATVSTDPGKKLVDADVAGVGVQVGLDNGVSADVGGDSGVDVDLGAGSGGGTGGTGGTGGGGTGGGTNVDVNVGGGGSDGKDGTNGDNGSDGGTGSDGSAGKDGEAGTSGKAGTSGTAGTSGKDGVTRTVVVRGKDGVSRTVVVNGSAGRTGASVAGSAGTSKDSKGSTRTAKGSTTAENGTGDGTDSTLGTDGDRLTAGSTGHGFVWWASWFLLAVVLGGFATWLATTWRRRRAERALRRRMANLARELHDPQAAPQQRRTPVA